MQGLVNLEGRLKAGGSAIAQLAHRLQTESIPQESLEQEYSRVATLLREAKRAGFADRTIAEFAGVSEMLFRRLRKALGIVPIYKMVDTCAAEFEAATPYYYSCYDKEDE